MIHVECLRFFTVYNVLDTYLEIHQNAYSILESMSVSSVLVIMLVINNICSVFLTVSSINLNKIFYF